MTRDWKQEEDEEEDAANNNEGQPMCATVLVLLFLAGALSLGVITCVLVGETWSARDACGSLLWWVLLARLVWCGLAALAQCFVWCDAEPGLRARMELPPLEDDDAGGLCSLIFGGDAHWVARVVLWALHIFFMTTLAVGIVRLATGDAACAAAFASSSFTHDATGLVGVAWAWLATDAVGAVGLTAELVFGTRMLGYNS